MPSPCLWNLLLKYIMVLEKHFQKDTICLNIDFSRATLVHTSLPTPWWKNGLLLKSETFCKSFWFFKIFSFCGQTLKCLHFHLLFIFPFLSLPLFISLPLNAIQRMMSRVLSPLLIPFHFSFDICYSNLWKAPEWQKEKWNSATLPFWNFSKVDEVCWFLFL